MWPFDCYIFVSFILWCEQEYVILLWFNNVNVACGLWLAGVQFWIIFIHLLSHFELLAPALLTCDINMGYTVYWDMQSYILYQIQSTLPLRYVCLLRLLNLFILALTTGVYDSRCAFYMSDVCFISYSKRWCSKCLVTTTIIYYVHGVILSWSGKPNKSHILWSSFINFAKLQLVSTIDI